jgi:hypothetical protein
MLEEKEKELALWELKLQKCERFVLAMQHRALHAAFARWEDMAAEQIAMRRKARNVAARFTKRAMTAAFERWFETTCDLRRQRVIVRRAIAKIAERALSQAFYQWQGEVIARNERVIAEQERWQQDIKKVERFVLAWQNRFLSAAFFQWNANWREMKVQRRILNNCLVRMSQRLVYAAVSGWADHVVEIKRQRVIMRRALFRVTQRKVAQAFYDWRDAIADAKAFAYKAHVSQRFLKAMMQRTAFAAFHRWKDVTRDAMLAEVKIRRSILRIMDRTVASSFLDWQWKVSEKRKHVEKEEKARKLWEAKLQKCDRFVLAMQHRALHAAFARWEEMTEEVRSQRRRVRLVAARLTKLAAVASFARWIDVVDELKRQRSIVRRVLAKIGERAKSSAFYEWLDAVDARKDAEARDSERWLARLKTAERFLFAMQKRSLSHAFVRWRRVRAHLKEQRGKINVVLARIKSHAAHAALITWDDNVRELRRQRLILTRAVSKFSRRALTETFYAWADKITNDKQHAHRCAVAARFLRAIQQRSLFCAFNRWLVQTKNAIENENKVRRSVLRLAGETLSFSFLEWHRKVREKRANEELMEREARLWEFKLQKCERFVMAMLQRSLHDAFARWAEMTEEKRRARLAVRRAVTKLTKRAMAATFERWSDVVVELRRQRVIVRRVLARVTERVKSSAFRDWLDALETRKEAEAADQAAWRRDVVKVERYVRAMRHRGLSDAFRNWHENWRRNKLARRKLNGYLVRMTLRDIAFAFDGWAHATRKFKRERQLVRRACEKISRRRVAEAFYDWHKSLRDDQKYAYAVQKSERYLLAINKNLLFRAFTRWNEQAANIKRMDLQLSRAILRMQDKYLARAFIDWAEKVEAKRQHVVDEAKEHRHWLGKIHLCDRYVAAMLDKLLFASFASWRAAAENATRLKRLLHGVGTRFAHRSMGAAFNAWVERVDDARHYRAAYASVLKQWLRANRASAFMTWRDATLDAKDARATGRRVIARAKNRSMFRAFSKWHARASFCDELAECNARKMRASARRRAFRAWAAQRLRTNASAKLAAKIFIKHGRRVLREAFSDWEIACGDKRRRRAYAAKMIQRAVRPGTRSSFEHWAWLVRERREARVKTSRFIDRDRRVRVRASFDRWARRAVDEKRRRRSIDRVTRRVVHRQCARAFDRWIDVAKDWATTRRKMRRHVARWSVIATARAFERWVAFFGESRKQRVVVRAFVHRMSNLTTARAFAGWTAARAAANESRGKMRKVVARVARAKLAAAFDGWFLSLDDAKRARVIARRAIAHWSKKALADAFDAWATKTSTWHAARVAMARVAARWTRRRASSAFNAWAHEARTFKRASEVASRRKRVKDVAAARAALVTWWSAHRDRKAMFTKFFADPPSRVTRLSVYFAKWMVNASTQRRVGHVRWTWARRRRTATMAYVFNGWVDETVENRRLRSVVARAATKAFGVQARTTRWSIVRWHQIAVKSRYEEGAAARAHQSLFESVGARVYYNLTRRRVAAAFRGWRSNASETRRAIRLLYRAAVRLAERRVSRAFNAWLDITSETGEHHRKLHMASRCVRAMSHRKLYAAFRGWWTRTSERRRLFSTLLRAASKLARRRLATAFGKWAHEHRRADAMHLVGRRNAVHVQRMFDRVHDRCRTLAYKRWVEFASERKRDRRLAVRAIRRMTDRRASRAFLGWRERASERKRVKRVVIRAAQRMMRKRLASSFWTWVERAAEGREEKEREKSLAAKCDRVVAAKIKRVVAKAFRGWWKASAYDARLNMDATREEAIEFNSVASAFARVRSRNTREACFFRWVALAREASSDYVAPRKYARDRESEKDWTRELAIRDMFVRRAFVKRLRLFNAWKRWTARRIALAARVGNEMRVFVEQRAARRALRAWNDLAYERLARESAEATAKRHRFATLMTPFLRAWGVHAKKEAADARAVAAALAAATKTPGAGTGLEPVRGGGGGGGGGAFSPIALPSLSPLAGATGWDFDRKFEENLPANSPLPFAAAAGGGAAPFDFDDALERQQRQLARNLEARAAMRERVAATPAAATPAVVTHVAPAFRPPPSPPKLHGALDPAHRKVIEEIAALEGVVSAQTEELSSRLSPRRSPGVNGGGRDGGGARPSSSAASASIDSRLLDMEARMTGLLMQKESLREEMSGVGSAARSEDSARRSTERKK